MTDQENQSPRNQASAPQDQAGSSATETPAAGAPPTAEQPPRAGVQSGVQWERDIISRVAFAALAEQRRQRRWSIFFRGLLFIYLFMLLFLYWPVAGGPGFGEVGKKHTALVEVSGVIMPDSEASADSVIGGLRAAFEDENTAGVILRINSPGGSPVQAGYINDEIRRLREKYADIPVYAVITDVCASGGYYVAVAADEIYADKASLVGSIGVLVNGFGFVETMDKLGVERRLMTAGEHKGFLDPFSPEQPGDVAHMEKILENTHQQFVNVVREGRGDRLKDDPSLFSGLVWTGEQSVELGLVDGLGSSSYVAREVIGHENIVNYTRRPSPFARFADRIGVSMANALIQAVGINGATLR